jgi:ATPase subunit of ABC transporter with duplicated ATPase domains
MDDLKAAIKAARDSGAHEYIRTFEAYYHTVLQREYNTKNYDWYVDYIPGYHYIDKLEEREIPFMVKLLGDDLHARAKVQDKLIVWADPPEKKIDTKIPPHDPSDDDGERTSYRSLSGGQWQRIALARAFMTLQDADLLILDEPSSALDPQAEYQVFKSLLELRKNKTTIYIVCSLQLERLTLVPSFPYCAGSNKNIGMCVQDLLTSAFRGR